MNEEDIKQHIAAVAGFPKLGIVFRDITPLLAAPEAFGAVIKRLADIAPATMTHVAAIEARGFLFAAPLAAALGVPFVPIRKTGKLPRPTISARYGLEYGSDEIAMHKDALDGASRVYLIDDLIATGGTLAAAVKLIGEAGGIVAKVACVIELSGLNGREKLPPSVAVEALVRYSE